MFDDNFYAKFDDKKFSYIIYANGSPVYGKDIITKINERYSSVSSAYRTLEFENDINEAYREYCKVCHISLVYDNFSDSMKSYLESRDICDRKFLCEYQRMTRKQIFYCFDKADDIELLYEVACVLFSDKNDDGDEHEDA